MSEDALGTSTRPSVLIVAADPGVETTLVQMVGFTRYHVVVDVTVGVAGESIRRVRPEVAILDTTLRSAVLGACVAAANEVGSEIVLTSATASDAELMEEACSRHCSSFALPAGPKPLAGVIERALAKRPHACSVDLPSTLGNTLASARAPICAAVGSVARARVLAARVDQLTLETKALRDEVARNLQETKRSYAALRAAVTEYARELKAEDMPLEGAISRLREAIRDCAIVVGARSSEETLLRDTEKWARAEYAA